MNSHCFKNSWILFNFNLCRCLQNFLGLNLKGPYQSLEKGRGSFVSCSPAPWSRRVKLGIVLLRLRNVQKSVIHMQSCCFANINLLLFCRSRCFHCQSCLSSILLWSTNFATMVAWCHTSPLCYLKYYIMTCLEPFPLGKWTWEATCPSRKKNWAVTGVWVCSE